MIKFFVCQKFRFDLGSGFLSIFIFTMIAADKIQLIFHIAKARHAYMLCLALGLLVVWIIGYILDKFRYMELYNREYNARNEDIQTIKNKL